MSVQRRTLLISALASLIFPSFNFLFHGDVKRATPLTSRLSVHQTLGKPQPTPCRRLSESVSLPALSIFAWLDDIRAETWGWSRKRKIHRPRANKNQALRFVQFKKHYVNTNPSHLSATFIKFACPVKTSWIHVLCDRTMPPSSISASLRRRRVTHACAIHASLMLTCLTRKNGGPQARHLTRASRVSYFLFS